MKAHKCQEGHGYDVEVNSRISRRPNSLINSHNSQRRLNTSTIGLEIRPHPHLKLIYAISTPTSLSSLPCPVAPPQGIMHQVSSIYLHIYHLVASSSGLALLNSTYEYHPRGMYCSPEWCLVDASAPNFHIRHQGAFFAPVCLYTVAFTCYYRL